MRKLVLSILVRFYPLKTRTTPLPPVHLSRYHVRSNCKPHDVEKCTRYRHSRSSIIFIDQKNHICLLRFRGTFTNDAKLLQKTLLLDTSFSSQGNSSDVRSVDRRLTYLIPYTQYTLASRTQFYPFITLLSSICVNVNTLTFLRHVNI